MCEFSLEEGCTFGVLERPSRELALVGVTSGTGSAGEGRALLLPC